MKSDQQYSGLADTHIRDVAFLVSKEKANTLLEWEPIRMIRARFKSKYYKFTVIQCYVPTKEADEEDKDTWYEQLQFAIFKVPGHDMLTIIGDMNAKVRSDNTNYGRAMGKRVVRSMRMVTVLLVSV